MKLSLDQRRGEARLSTPDVERHPGRRALAAVSPALQKLPQKLVTFRGRRDAPISPSPREGR